METQKEIGRQEVPLVEYRGLLPRQPAEFLSGLEDWERKNVYALLGTFEEVRALIGTARLVHLFLKEGPASAARGRLSFQEFVEEKEALKKEILALRRRVNGCLEKVSLRLPRVPGRKEAGDGEAALRRVS